MEKGRRVLGVSTVWDSEKANLFSETTGGGGVCKRQSEVCRRYCSARERVVLVGRRIAGSLLEGARCEVVCVVLCMVVMMKGRLWRGGGGGGAVKGTTTTIYTSWRCFEQSTVVTTRAHVFSKKVRVGLRRDGAVCYSSDDSGAC